MANATISTMHMAYLAGLLPSPVFELGPAAVQVPPGFEDTVIEQLTATGFITGPDTLSDGAKALLEPLTAYEEAYTGVILLHNERQPVQLDIDDQWMEFLKNSLTDLPRVYFLVARSGNVLSVAVRAGEQIDLSQRTIPGGPFAPVAATVILDIGDPQHEWKPLKIAPVMILQALVEKAPVRRPNSDVDEPAVTKGYRAQADRFIAAVRGEGLSPSTATTLRTLLTYDHVAQTHVVHSNGPRKLLSEGAATIDYFHDRGVSVSGVRKTADGGMWKSIMPATAKNVADALHELTRIPASPLESSLPRPA
ncbi:hypothetical protein EEB14_22945 [Rhodococcus sp. WS4]|nr:hypothetical protein EEB14_22945 [Rhodococcus sp. WS4]